VIVYREILKLKDCFSSLDDDNSGSIGVEELQEPLIGLGFANNVEDVMKMVE
jgi:Ca2+-binding EF-hand superfamily protein